jgi:hypothetical protein
MTLSVGKGMTQQNYIYEHGAYSANGGIGASDRDIVEKAGEKSLLYFTTVCARHRGHQSPPTPMEVR